MSVGNQIFFVFQLQLIIYLLGLWNLLLTPCILYINNLYLQVDIIYLLIGVTGKSKYVINLSHAMFELCINIDSVHFGNVRRYTFIVSFSKLNGQFSIMESTHSIITN